MPRHVKPRKYATKTTAAVKAAAKKASEHMGRIRLTPATLTMSHVINGITWGPGEVKGPNDLIRSLLNAESKARQAEDIFQGSRGMIIGPRNTTKLVPTEHFDDSLFLQHEALTVDGKNPR
jgi:hypothetical protein